MSILNRLNKGLLVVSTTGLAVIFGMNSSMGFKFHSKDITHVSNFLIPRCLLLDSILQHVRTMYYLTLSSWVNPYSWIFSQIQELFCECIRVQDDHVYPNDTCHGYLVHLAIHRVLQSIRTDASFGRGVSPNFQTQRVSLRLKVVMLCWNFLCTTVKWYKSNTSIVININNGIFHM